MLLEKKERKELKNPLKITSNKKAYIDYKQDKLLHKHRLIYLFLRVKLILVTLFNPSQEHHGKQANVYYF